MGADVEVMSEYEAHIEVQPHVHLIRGKNRARFPEANSLLIDDEILTLIDAGSSISQIESTLHDLGHSVNDLDRIILTHFHIDHKGYAEEIRKTAECEVLCNRLSEKGIRTFEGMVELYGAGIHRFYKDWKIRIGEWLPHIVDEYHVDGNFRDGVPISCGEIEIIPIHLPGHTLDHTGFGINGLDTIFLVDIDLTRFGPWYGNAVSDIYYFKRSIEIVMELDPKNVISSHLLDPVTENIIERLETFLDVFNQRDERILKNVSEGHDTIEKLGLIPTIYPRIPHNLFYIFEEIMLEKHLEQFVELNVLHVEDGQYSLVRG
ncbi:MAG: MBL fold metallo-hydrolase [Candidatus Thorarchaeota archaeon]